MAVPLIAAGIGLLGGVLSSNAQKDAARTSSNAQLEAARIAAEEARFRPVGVTTAFGSSQFGFGPDGRLTSAGYALTPQMQALRDQLLASAGGAGMATAAQGMQAGQGLFNLGQGYLAQSPEQAAQQWMASQQNLLAPSRERALSGVRQNLFNTGRTGLAVGATGLRPDMTQGLRAANPEMEAYYNALAQSDAQLAAQAQEQGRAQTTFGQGLLGSGIDIMSAGYNPFKTQLGLAGNIENLGQGAFDLGTGLGAKIATGSGTAANALMQGGTNAANIMQRANSYSPFGTALAGAAGNEQLMAGIGNWLSGSGGGQMIDMTGFQQPYQAPTYSYTAPTPALGSGMWNPGPSSYSGKLGSGLWSN